MEKQQTKITLNSPLDPENSYEAVRLIDLISKLSKLLDGVPKEHRNDVMFSLVQYGDQYDGYSCVEHEIFYSRLESDDELGARLNFEASRQRGIKDREMRELQRLKAKYDP